MRIAILDAPRRFTMQERPVPEIGPNQVLVRVAACGVCTSELHIWDGTAGDAGFPRSLGHEVSGVVERAGAGVTSLQAGDRVAIWRPGGGYAEYVAVEAGWCFSAGDVPLDLALGEPIACAVNAVELADVRLGDDVVIIGAGYMGNLVQQLVALRGPRHIIVADTRPEALKRAAALGATRTIDVTRESVGGVVCDITESGADVSFEVTGAQAALKTLGEVTRMSGTVAIVGYHQGGCREIPLAQWNWMAYRIANAHFRDETIIRRGMETAMRLLSAGRLDLKNLVTHRFGLDEIDDAFRVAEEKPSGFCKATVVVDEALI